MAQLTTTIRLELNREQYDAIERLRLLAGKSSIEETILAALKTYGLKEVNGIVTAINPLD